MRPAPGRPAPADEVVDHHEDDDRQHEAQHLEHPVDVVGQARADVAAGGSAGVQIGAFSTPSLAEREYNTIVGRYPQLTEGGSRRVQEVTASNGSTVYRTTVTGLSQEQARALCGAIRASGGDCILR